MEHSSCQSNQRNHALDVGKGESGTPPNLRHTLQLKLSSDKVKVDKNKDFYWELGGKKYIYFLNVLLLNTFNIES